MKMTKEELDTTSTEQLVCPYCGEEQEDAREAENLGEAELFTCSDCCRDFVYSTETYLLYTSEDMGEHFKERLEQEKYWRSVITKDLETSDWSERENAKQGVQRNLARCEQKIRTYEERLKDYEAQKFQEILNKEDSEDC